MKEKDYTIDLEDIFKAYYDCRKNKRRTANALAFEFNYEDECVRLWREINERTYEIGRSITFVVTKPKPREIFAADFRDRIAHHLVVGRLEPLFEKLFIEDTYNCRKGKGTLYGVKRLAQKLYDISEGYTKDCYIAKFDMQGFFMSIHKPTLNSMLQAFIDNEYDGCDKDAIMWLVEKIVLHCPEKNCVRKSPLRMWNLIPDNKSLFKNGDDYGLAIGNLTSQIFANFYLHNFDKIMSAKFEGYGRYVDDFYVISKSKELITKSIGFIGEYLKSTIGITLHPDKFYLQHYSKGVKFTGMVVKPNRTYIGNATRANFINKIRMFNKKLDKDEGYTIEDAEHFISSMNSYLGFFRHHKGFNIRKGIIDMLDTRWWRMCHWTAGIEKVGLNKKYKVQAV